MSQVTFCPTLLTGFAVGTKLYPHQRIAECLKTDELAALHRTSKACSKIYQIRMVALVSILNCYFFEPEIYLANSRETFEKALAARKNTVFFEKCYWHCANAILNQEDIGPSFKGNALTLAAGEGLVHFANYIINNGFIDETYIGEALLYAASAGHHLIVKMVLKKCSSQYRSMTVIYRGRAIAKAAEKGYLEIVRDLVKSGSFSTQHFDEAIYLATKNNHRKVLNLFATIRT